MNVLIPVLGIPILSLSDLRFRYTRTIEFSLHSCYPYTQIKGPNFSLVTPATAGDVSFSKAAIRSSGYHSMTQVKNCLQPIIFLLKGF